MKGFSALLRLQLLSRLADLKPQNLKNALAQKKGKALGTLLAYVLLIVWVLGFVGFLEYTILTSLMKIGMADLLLDLAVTASMLATLILAFFFIMSSLYFGRDNAFLASLPVSTRTVLASKLTQVWLSEVGTCALFLLPAGILYGVRMGADALFYGRLLLVLAGVPVLPLVIVTFLSTLLIRLSSLWKRREMVATVGGIGLLIAYMFFCMRLGSVMPDDPTDFINQFFTDNQARIVALTRTFPPAAWAAKGLLGDWMQLLIFLLACALATALTLWAVGLVYRKLSLLQGETAAAPSRKGRKGRSFAGSSAFKACCRWELRQIFRIPAYATNILPMALMPVLMVGCVAGSVGGQLEAGATLESRLGDINPAIAMGVMTALMAFIGGMSPAVSSAVTREGKGHAFVTALPLPPRTAVLAKMAVGMGITLVGLIAAAILLMVLMPSFALEAGLALVACILFCYFAGAISLANDVAHPKLNWLTETEAIKQKSGTLIGILICWALLILLAIGSYFLISAGASLALYAAALLAVLALGALLGHKILMHTADTSYCQGE